VRALILFAGDRDPGGHGLMAGVEVRYGDPANARDVAAAQSKKVEREQRHDLLPANIFYLDMDGRGRTARNEDRCQDGQKDRNSFPDKVQD
jgi:hypothetical protein